MDETDWQKTPDPVPSFWLKLTRYNGHSPAGETMNLPTDRTCKSASGRRRWRGTHVAAASLVICAGICLFAYSRYWRGTHRNAGPGTSDAPGNVCSGDPRSLKLELSSPKINLLLHEPANLNVSLTNTSSVPLKIVYPYESYAAKKRILVKGATFNGSWATTTGIIADSGDFDASNPAGQWQWTPRT